MLSINFHTVLLLTALCALTHVVKEQELRNHLGSFGIKGALATQPMRSLSGGQAVRVGLAAVAFASPQLLVLVTHSSPHPHVTPCVIQRLVWHPLRCHAFLLYASACSVWLYAEC